MAVDAHGNDEEATVTATGPTTGFPIPTAPRATTATPGPRATPAATAAPEGSPSSPESALPLVWVEPWPDAEEAGLRHHLRSDYVETFWLPVLGPSSVLLLRLLRTGLAHAPGGYTLDLAEAARMLGIGHRGGRNGPMSRTLERCCAFGATRLDHGHQLLVRESLATLGARQVARLPQTLQQRHATAVREAARQPVTAPVEAMRSRCRTLALSLLELGEGPEDAEVQLHRWRFHPAMAHESVVWAQHRLAGQAPPAGSPREPGDSGGADRVDRTEPRLSADA